MTLAKAECYYADISRYGDGHRNYNSGSKRCSMTARVLVADDNDDCRAVLRMLLTHLGFTVVEAINGLEAIEKAVNTHPSLIIMDLRMPKLGGLEALRRIKKIPSTKDIPIVICSAMGREALGYAGLVDYPLEVVQKPIKLQKIKDIVSKYLPQENQQQASIAVEKKETVDVIRAWRLLQNIKHSINEDSLGVRLSEAHHFHSGLTSDKRGNDSCADRDDKKREALSRLLLTIKGGKLFAGFVKLLPGAIGCLDLLSIA